MKTQEHLAFLQDSETKAFDENHRRVIAFNIGQYNKKAAEGKARLQNVEELRQQAKHIRATAIENLADYLEQFERVFKSRGGRVIWAETAEQACQAVLEIAQLNQATRFVKSKTMVTEEIELNHFLEENGLEVLETDLGEYIVQIAGEKPYHIITPIMHKSKEDVAALFYQKFGTPPDASPEFIMNYVREKLRKNFLAADIGITGANFLVADTGSVVVCENEGNARMTTAFPRIHIAIAGIEKIIPSIKDLGTLLPLLATYGTGQPLTVYNSLFSGPRQANETDGPDQMYVILLDNGRTNLLADPIAREALYCIRCGACLNGCPIYRTVGGHSYGTTYQGPIGSVITPHLKGMKEFGHLSAASSLCGKCTEVCPVGINLHELLLHNREKYATEVGKEKTELRAWQLWQQAMLNRWMIDIVPTNIKVWGFRKWLLELWGQHRNEPKFPKQSFNSLWKAGKV